MKTRRHLFMLLLLSGCATSGGGEPSALCRAVATELGACTEAIQHWQAEGTGERPVCEAEAAPAVTGIVDAAGRAYPDHPQNRREYERIARNLEMTQRFLARDKTVEARLLLSKIDDRCAALP